jgi:hypothetical protein
MNIYQVTVPDRMHHLDLGLFHYQILYTKELLKKQYGNTLNDEIDSRLAAIPRFPELKIFTSGLRSISRLTADEYRNLMKVMIFVLDNLYGDDKRTNDFVSNNDLTKLYKEWNKMYIISKYEVFKESDLIKFKVCIIIFIVKIHSSLLIYKF